MLRRSFLAVLASPLVCADAAWAQPSAQEFLRQADRIRLPQESFRVTNTLTEFIDGKAADRLALTVFSKPVADGAYRTLVRYEDPARDRGKLVLFSGQDLWFYDPASKASVRISPQQRLLGQAANGDVVTANLGADYVASAAGIETLQDADKTPRTCVKLDLKPRTAQSLYGRVEYWVEQSSARPVKAKFYADSGRLLKIAYYRRFSMVMGASRPTETIIIDGVNPRLATTMATDGYAAQVIPDTWLQRDFLPRVPQR